MASDWTDWADGNDLAGMSRSTSPLTSAGYDPDEVRANPALRQQVMQQAASLYGLQPRTVAANGPVTPALDIRNAAPTPAAPQPIPNAAVKPPTLEPVSEAATPAAAPKPAATNMSKLAAAPELDAVGREALEKGLALGNFAQQNAETLASADPGTAALEAQAAKDATPTPYLDPATGKPLESAKQFEPTGMQKFERGLKGAAIGFLTGGPFGAGIGAIDPGLVHGGTAYDAPNAAYNATEAAREQRLAGDQAQIAGLKDRFKAMTDARKAANTAAGTAATAFGDVDKGVSSMQPKPDKTGAPQTMMVDGKPALVNWDPQKGYLSAAPGPTFGQPVQGTVSEMPAAGKPQAGLVNGKPGFAIESPQGWLDGRVGPNYGKPLPAGSSFVPTPTRSEAAGAGTGLNAPGNPALHGEEYLASIPSSLAATVRAIGEGREAPPSAGNRSKAAMEILNAVNQAYPAYDATQYPTYAAARKAFTSGSIGIAINAFNTALNHLGRMEANIPKENSSFSTLNAVENAVAPSGSKRGLDIGRFKTDANAVANEVQKAYKGGVVNQDEYNQMIALLNANASPAQIQSNIAELRQLLNGKLDGYRKQWASQGPPGVKMPTPGVDEASTATGGAIGGTAGSGGFDWGTHTMPVKGH